MWLNKESFNFWARRVNVLGMKSKERKICGEKFVICNADKALVDFINQVLTILNRPFFQPAVHFFGTMQIKIDDPRSLRSWCIKGTNESLPRVDSSVPLMHHDLGDLGSLILIWIIPKKCTPGV